MQNVLAILTKTLQYADAQTNVESFHIHIVVLKGFRILIKAKEREVKDSI